MGGGYYLQKVVPTVRGGSEWTCLGWSCPNEVVRYIALCFQKQTFTICHPGSCGKPDGLFGDQSEEPNRFPTEDSLSESSVGKFGWVEGREVEEEGWARPRWKSREGEDMSQPWLPGRGTYATAKQHNCWFRFLNFNTIANPVLSYNAMWWCFHVLTGGVKNVAIATQTSRTFSTLPVLLLFLVILNKFLHANLRWWIYQQSCSLRFIPRRNPSAITKEFTCALS